MTLFINEKEGHSIYKNSGHLKPNNQGYFYKDHLSDILSEQHTMNNYLINTLQKVDGLYKEQSIREGRRWEEVRHKLRTLEKFSEGQEQMEKELVYMLQALKTNDEKIYLALRNERVKDKHLTDQMKEINETSSNMSYEIKDHQLAIKEVAKLVTAQADNQQVLSEKLTDFRNYHQELLDRIEAQELFTEKVARQMDFFRSTVFERTSFLADKIEDIYKLIATFLEQLTWKTNLPITNMMIMNNKKDAERLEDK